MPTLLDTHAWVWWVTDDRRLSSSARRTIQRASSAGTLLLSLISVWEVGRKAEKGQLVLDRPVETWIDDALGQPGLQTLELTRTVLVASCRLPGPFHGDPADQLIVATAREREATILTRDDRIRRYSYVRSSW